MKTHMTYIFLLLLILVSFLFYHHSATQYSNDLEEKLLLSTAIRHNRAVSDLLTASSFVTKLGKEKHLNAEDLDNLYAIESFRYIECIHITMRTIDTVGSDELNAAKEIFGPILIPY